MEENFKNKLGFWTFFLLVLFLAVGGYFFTNYAVNLKNDSNKDKKELVVNHKIDKDKDYIYFINGETISEGAEIFYQDVVINLDTQTHITEALEKENKIYKNNIKYLSDVELLSSELVNYNFDNLYALTFRNYKVYEYSDYVSLVIDTHNYSCFDLNTFISTKSYIFNVKDGSLLSNEELLKKYNLSMENILEKVRNKLNETQKLVDEVELINIEDTINNLNYSLFINEYGKLNISFLVKTTQVDYNEIMEV